MIDKEVIEEGRFKIPSDVWVFLIKKQRRGYVPGRIVGVVTKGKEKGKYKVMVRGKEKVIEEDEMCLRGGKDESNQ